MMMNYWNIGWTLRLCCTFLGYTFKFWGYVAKFRGYVNKLWGYAAKLKFCPKNKSKIPKVTSNIWNIQYPTDAHAITHNSSKYSS